MVWPDGKYMILRVRQNWVLISALLFTGYVSFRELIHLYESVFSFVKQAHRTSIVRLVWKLNQKNEQCSQYGAKFSTVSDAWICTYTHCKEAHLLSGLLCGIQKIQLRVQHSPCTYWLHDNSDDQGPSIVQKRLICTTEVPHVYFSPGDSSKRPAGVIGKCLDSDATIHVKALRGRWWAFHNRWETDLRLWKGLCF